MISLLFSLIAMLPLEVGERGQEEIVEVAISDESTSCEEEDRRPKLKAVVILSDLSQLNQVEITQDCGLVDAQGCLPGNGHSLNKQIVQELGCPIDKELILQIRSQVIAYYQEQGRPLVSIDIPQQDITGGILQLVVTEARVGKIEIQDGKYYSKEQLSHMIPLHPGDILDTRVLYSDLDWINRSAYRHADLILQPGENENTTDIEIKMDDRFPFRIYAGVDNTGNAATGNNRLFTGFYLSNIFKLDHTFAFQATSSSDFDQFYSYTLNYIAPLPNRHVFVAFGGYSKIHPQFSALHSVGESIQASGRYQIPFASSGKGSLQEFIIGLDYKNTNNNLLFLSAGEIPIIAKRVEYLQIMFGHNYGWSTRKHTLSSNLQVFGSPGKVFDDSADANFDAIQPHATNLYLYGRFIASYAYTWDSGTSLYLCGQSQLSTSTLLPGEEMGVGGYDTVRGYREREVDADNAVVANVELRSPKMRLFSSAWGGKKYQDFLFAYGFLDYGYASELHPQPGEDKNQQLLSIGVGCRYNLDPFVSFRFDWGLRLHRSEFEPAGGSRVHFGLIAGY